VSGSVVSKVKELAWLTQRGLSNLHESSAVKENKNSKKHDIVWCKPKQGSHK